MPKRHESSKEYISPKDVIVPDVAPSIVQVALRVPLVLKKFDVSYIKQHQLKPDWSLYRVEIRDKVPYVVREMCDRCGKVWIAPRWRKLREYYDEDIGCIYLEAGICKDCINASVYVDKFLDGEVLSEKDAKALFYSYAAQYEKAWRLVLATANNIALTEAEWEHRCAFFGGCAFCGASVEVRAKYFPIYLNGSYTSWNVIPLCGRCQSIHYAGRTSKDREVHRYKVFSTFTHFNKSKTLRMYLIRQMEKHKLYVEPLKPFRERFFETKLLEGSD